MTLPDLWDHLCDVPPTNFAGLAVMLVVLAVLIGVTWRAIR